MSRLLITSDLHLGHKNTWRFRPEFESAEYHHEFVFNNLVSSVKRRDMVLFLGDITFTEEWLDRISEIQCERKILIAGNHDTDNISMRKLTDVYDEVYALYRRGGYLYSHAPIHPNELRGKINIHGHVHHKTIDDPRYFNACLENTDMKPIDINTIRERLQENKEGQ